MFQRKVPYPKITFIIVEKRHHVRFIPLRDSEQDRSGNVPAGFVADTGITSPNLFNFYLQSHAGILGSKCINNDLKLFHLIYFEHSASRSAHYVVLKDENDMNADM